MRRTEGRRDRNITATVVQVSGVPIRFRFSSIILTLEASEKRYGPPASGSEVNTKTRRQRAGYYGAPSILSVLLTTIRTYETDRRRAGKEGPKKST